MQQQSLEGQVALVTGASRGIGRAIALALGRERVHVGLVARSQPQLSAVKAEVEAEGGSATVLPADVADEVAARAAVQHLLASRDRLNILVNCAGIGVLKPLVDTTTQEWDRIMAVNARGAFVMCREALPIMARQGAGCIVNIASVVGVKGYVNQGAYTASKHALVGMTKVLAQEAGPMGVRVHVVCPGGVDTELVAQARPDLDRSVLMRPEEIAALVLFLIAQRGAAIVDQINVRRASSAPWFG